MSHRQCGSKVESAIKGPKTGFPKASLKQKLYFGYEYSYSGVKNIKYRKTTKNSKIKFSFLLFFFCFLISFVCWAVFQHLWFLNRFFRRFPFLPSCQKFLIFIITVGSDFIKQQQLVFRALLRNTSKLIGFVSCKTMFSICNCNVLGCLAILA